MSDNSFDTSIQTLLSEKREYATGMLIFLCTFLFAFLFEPFHIDKSEHQYGYALICMCFAGNALIAYIVMHIISSKISIYLSGFVRNILLLLLIGILNFLIRPVIYSNPDNYSWNYLAEELIHALLFGTLLLLLIHLLLSVISRKSAEHHVEESINETLQISTASKTEHLTLDPHSFVYAESEGNYLMVYQICNNKLAKKLVRMTITDFEKIFKDHSSIIRVHRSFIINIRYIRRAEGNTKGYTLTMEQGDTRIPVSRANSSRFAELYKSYPDHSSH